MSRRLNAIDLKVRHLLCLIHRKSANESRAVSTNVDRDGRSTTLVSHFSLGLGAFLTHGRSLSSSMPPPSRAHQGRALRAAQINPVRRNDVSATGHREAARRIASQCEIRQVREPSVPAHELAWPGRKAVVAGQDVMRHWPLGRGQHAAQSINSQCIAATSLMRRGVLWKTVHRRRPRLDWLRNPELGAAKLGVLHLNQRVIVNNGHW